MVEQILYGTFAFPRCPQVLEPFSTSGSSDLWSSFITLENCAREREDDFLVHYHPWNLLVVLSQNCRNVLYDSCMHIMYRAQLESWFMMMTSAKWNELWLLVQTLFFILAFSYSVFFKIFSQIKAIFFIIFFSFFGGQKRIFLLYRVVQTSCQIEG